MEELKVLAKEKEVQCLIQARAYSLWLSSLKPANLILVVGGALLSLVAGASLLIEQGVLTKEVAGVLALISASFTIIHSKLNCDEHQAECKKLKSVYQGLSEEYANLQTEGDVSILKKKLDALNSERTLIIKNSNAEPSQNSLDKAKIYYEKHA